MLLLGYLPLFIYVSNIMATNKNKKMDAIIVTLGGIYLFFRRKSKSIKTCLFLNPSNSRGLKEGLYKPSQNR